MRIFFLLFGTRSSQRVAVQRHTDPRRSIVVIVVGVVAAFRLRLGRRLLLFPGSVVFAIAIAPQDAATAANNAAGRLFCHGERWCSGVVLWLCLVALLLGVFYFGLVGKQNSGIRRCLWTMNRNTIEAKGHFWFLSLFLFRSAVSVSSPFGRCQTCHAFLVVNSDGNIPLNRSERLRHH